MKSLRREPISERPGISVFPSERADLLIHKFVSLNGSGSGTDSRTLSTLRNDISSYLFEYLEGFRIPTHFVEKVTEDEMCVKQTEPIPLRVRVCNVSDDLLSARFGLARGTVFDVPIIEHYTSEDNGQPGTWVNEYHLYALGIVRPDEFKQINRIASKANAVLRGLCDRRQLMLANLQLSFGRSKGQVLVREELSPLTCHFLDLSVPDSCERDSFRPDQDHADDRIAVLCDRLKMKV
jgi:phosphoribosylaminoimidazole-succinocarboxamide synthase